MGSAVQPRDLGGNYRTLTFLATLAYLKQERRTAHMFETDPKWREDDFGLSAKNDFFRGRH
ncbi:hypothetical protein DYL61_12545 [Pseudomonas nabeulensis]|uniref:Uncharacterized protein n=1 Tax=Pseudomonas nabeulensis TaxID=2293833 RepID=A0A4Z0B648_9PSED|nr:hypothetical protein DYL61_12545 [Pseudomonas nabeulensis]